MGLCRGYMGLYGFIQGLCRLIRVFTGLRAIYRVYVGALRNHIGVICVQTGGLEGFI